MRGRNTSYLWYVIQILVNILLLATTCSLLIIAFQKYDEICDTENLGMIICIANHNCAYIRNHSSASIFDFLPYLSQHNSCIPKKKTKKYSNRENLIEHDQVLFHNFTRSEVILYVLFFILFTLRRKILENKKIKEIT